MVGEFGKESLFLSKGPLLEWLNDTLDVQLDKIEQAGSGAVYCQLLHLIDPKCIKIKKVNFQATTDNHMAAQRNWKYVQEALHKFHVTKIVPVERLLKGRFQDNLEFMQWFHMFFQEHNGNEQKEAYNPLRERLKSKGGEIFGSPLMQAKHRRSLSKRRPMRAKRHLRYATLGANVNHLSIQKRNWPGNSRSYSRSPDSPTPPVSPNPSTRSMEPSKEILLEKLASLTKLEEQLKTNIEDQKGEKQKLFDTLYRVQTEWKPKTEFERELYHLFFEDSDLHVEGPLNCNRFVYFPPQLNFDISEEPVSQSAPDDFDMEDITLLPPSSDGSLASKNVDPSPSVQNENENFETDDFQSPLDRMRSKDEVRTFVTPPPGHQPQSLQSRLESESMRLTNQNDNAQSSVDSFDACGSLGSINSDAFMETSTSTTMSRIQSTKSEQHIRNELAKIENSFKADGEHTDLVKMKSAEFKPNLTDIFIDSNKENPKKVATET